jgi:CRP-like cAMP-binding protein
MLLEGTVSIRLVNPSDPSISREVAQRAANSPDAYFGEIALLTNQARTATVAALGKVTCARLTRTQFNDVLDQLQGDKKDKKKERKNKAGIVLRSQKASNANAHVLEDVRIFLGERGQKLQDERAKEKKRNRQDVRQENIRRSSTFVQQRAKYQTHMKRLTAEERRILEGKPLVLYFLSSFDSPVELACKIPILVCF